MREPLPAKTCRRDIGGKRLGHVALPSSPLVGFLLSHAFPSRPSPHSRCTYPSCPSSISALVSAETYCASACGTSGCRNDGRGCATWCDAYRCRESAWALLAQTVATTHKEGVPCIKTGARPGQKDLPSATYPFGRGSETKLQVQTLPCGASATRLTRSHRSRPPRRDDVPFLMII